MNLVATIACTFRLPPALLSDIRRVADELRASQNRVVTDLLTEGLARWQAGESVWFLRDRVSEQPGGKAVVYFVQSQKASAAVKIGYTTNLPHRLISLKQTYNCGELETLLVLPGTRELEQHLHAMFAHLRIEGEWFHPGEDLLTFVREQKAASKDAQEGLARPSGSVRLPADLMEAVEKRAAETGASLHTTVAEALRRGLELSAPPKPEMSVKVREMLARMESFLARLEGQIVWPPEGSPPPGLSVMPSEPAVNALTVAPVAVSEGVATDERVEVKVEEMSAPAGVSVAGDAKLAAIQNGAVPALREPLPAPPHVPRGMAPLPPREVEVDPTVPPLPLPSDVEDLMDLLP